jgi:hypothetical protein
MKNISKKWLIIPAILIVALFAVGVPVLAANGDNSPVQTPAVVYTAYGLGCVDSGTLYRVAAVLKVTPADLATQLRSGKTLAAIAGEKNVATSAVVDAILAPFTARVNLALQNGNLTQAQAQTYLDAARQAAGNLLTLSLTSAIGGNTWAGFCGDFLNSGFGPGMMGILGGCMGNPLVGPVTVPNAPAPSLPKVIGRGMMGGGFGCR